MRVQLLGVFLSLALRLCLGAPAESVVYIQDGSIDDFMGTILLAAEHAKGTVNFVGEVMVNGDSALPWSMSVAAKLHALLDLDAPVALSQCRGFNAFPWEYRADTVRVDALPALQGLKARAAAAEDGESWLARVLEGAAPGSVTVLCTAGLTPLADVLKARPSLAKAIRRLVWMGGAVDVPGNLDRKQFPFWSDKPEWNVFFDPFAADWLLRHTDFPVLLFPLDVSDATPISRHFLEELARRAPESPLAAFVYQCYNLTVDEPFYRLWDTVAAAYLGHPEFFAPPVPMALRVATEYPDQGATVRAAQGGREVQVFLRFAEGGKDALYRYVVDPAAP